MRNIVAMLVALSLLGACNSASERDAAAPEARPTEEPGDGLESPGRPVAGATEAEEKGKANASGRREKPTGQVEAPGDADTGAAGSEDGASAFNDGESEDDHSSALHPAAGRYVYRQRGYERFCQAAACEQQPLPPRQPVDVSVRARGPQRTVVVSEMRASDNRMVRTTTGFSRRNAIVTDVYARFTYEGFSFENSYTPRPPVETLRFPLKQGAHWSGSWEDSTSGDYSIDVLARENLEVSGRALQAYKLSMVTDFRGEFTGTSKALLWVDVATKTVVKTTGKVDLRSSFGRYVTEYDNHLRSGPRY